MCAKMRKQLFMSYYKALVEALGWKVEDFMIRSFLTQLGNHAL